MEKAKEAEAEAERKRTRKRTRKRKRKTQHHLIPAEHTWCPKAMLCAAIMTVFMPEAHTLLMVVQGVARERPAPMTAWRVGACPAPALMTLPRYASWTAAGSKSAQPAHHGTLKYVTETEKSGTKETVKRRTDLCECAFDGGGGELRARQRRQGAAHRPHGSPRSADNHNFL